MQQDYAENHQVELESDSRYDRYCEAVDKLEDRLFGKEFKDFENVDEALNAIKLSMWGNPEFYDRQREAAYLAEKAFELNEEIGPGKVYRDAHTYLTEITP